jgi:hypothetical protein
MTISVKDNATYGSLNFNGTEAVKFDATGITKLPLGSSEGTAGQVLKSNGTGVAPSWDTGSPVVAQLITDSTDITPNLYPSTQSNVGSSFSVNIPTTGLIRIAGLTVRWLNNATATQHYLLMGIRIGSTNYWFGYKDTNGTVSHSNVVAGTATVSIYKETRGPTYSSDGAHIIDIVANSVPTGTQTVQLIAGYETTNGTIKGTTITTRAVLEFVG